MMNWLKKYYTRRDTRINFWLEDLKLNLIGVGIMLAFCEGCKLYLDWKDKKSTESRIKEAISNNDELQSYLNED